MSRAGWSRRAAPATARARHVDNGPGALAALAGYGVAGRRLEVWFAPGHGRVDRVTDVRARGVMRRGNFLDQGGHGKLVGPDLCR